MLHNKDEMQKYDYSGGFEASPLGSLSPAAQVGIVGGIVGVFGLAIADALLGLQEWMLLPECAVIGLGIFGTRYYLKKRNLDLAEYIKNLNWDALIPGYEARVVEGTVVEVSVEEVPDDGDNTERLVVLGDTLQLDIDALVGKSMFICGIRRSGKTTLGVRIAEELGRFGVPMLIPDLKGDWLSCVKTLPNAAIVGADTLTRDNAKEIGKSILGDRRQLIIDVASFDDMNDAGYILAEMIDGLFAWERAHPDSRLPVAVFLDEAQSFLPQDMNESIVPDKDIRTKLLSAYTRTTAVGGSLGLFPIVLSQRIAQTNKKLIGQSELAFLLKQRNHNDLGLYDKFIDIVGSQEILGFKAGQGVFIAEDGEQRVVQFHRRTSDDSMSRTPKIGNLDTAPQVKPFEEKIVPEEEDEEDEYVEDEGELSGDGLSDRERQYNQVLGMWEKGTRTLRPLSEAIGQTEWETRKILSEMNTLGLLSWGKHNGV